jgi:peptide/nickel transport system permease protein
VRRWAPLLVLAAALVAGPPLLARAGLDPLAVDPAGRLAPPSPAHPLGTDDLGRDVLARLVAGGRVTLGVALAGSALALGLGGALGASAGLAGGALDRGVLLLVDAWSAVPRLPVLLLLASVAPASPGGGLAREALRLGLLLGALSWAGPARVARAAARRAAASPSVRAARALGASEFRVHAVHVAPAVLGPLGPAAVECLAGMVLAESALSFLGFGAAPPTPSWGGLLARGAERLADAPHLVVAPALATALLVLAAQSLAIDAGARAGDG